MREYELLERAFAMPLTNPAYPPGPYRFVDREYLIIPYRTGPAKLRAVVPEPLESTEYEPVHTENLIRVDSLRSPPRSRASPACRIVRSLIMTAAARSSISASSWSKAVGFGGR